MEKSKPVNILVIDSMGSGFVQKEYSEDLNKEIEKISEQYFKKGGAMSAQLNRSAVKKLGDEIGYGNLMTLASETWEERVKNDPQLHEGHFVVGPCKAMTEECGCESGCDWCGGTRWLTKHVKKIKLKKEKETMSAWDDIRHGWLSEFVAADSSPLNVFKWLKENYLVPEKIKD